MFLVLFALLGCSSKSVETCFHVQVSYRGSRNGPSYAKIISTAGPSLQQSIATRTIEELEAVFNPVQTCYDAIDRTDQPVVAVAWIDVSGASASKCAVVASEDCQPSSEDPQAHNLSTIRDRSFTIIGLELVDPSP